MKHKHRIKPGYEGGEYCEGNVVKLSVTQHAMWHFAEWQRKGNWEDHTAWRVLVGQISPSEATLFAMKQGGRITSTKLHSLKDSDGKSVHAKKMSAARKPGPNGKLTAQSENMSKVNERIHAEKDEWGRSKHIAKNTQQRAIRLTNLETGETHDFPSQGVAAKIMDLQQAKLSRVLHGHQKSHKGFSVTFLEG